MYDPTPRTLDVTPGAPITIIERPESDDGVAIVAAAVTATGVSIHVFDLERPQPSVPVFEVLALAAGAGGVLAAVAPPDGNWTRDGTGYSYLKKLLPTDFLAIAGKRYRVEVRIVLAAGGVVSITRLVRVAPALEPTA